MTEDSLIRFCLGFFFGFLAMRGWLWLIDRNR